MRNATFLFFSAVLAALVIVAAVPGAAEEPTHGVTNAQAGEAVHPWFGGPVPDEDLTLPPHPPIDQIPPAPMPEPPEDGSSIESSGPGQPVFFDPATGVEEVLAMSAESSGIPGARGSGWEGPEGWFDSELDYDETFANMTTVTNQGDHPWRMNAKLVMRFVDTGGTDRWFVCSGSMMDAETVLTAGHCVFSRDASIMNWAATIYVYPGWDGTGSYNNRPVQTHGFATSAGLASWTGWTQNGDWDNDVGLVRLGRAVGMLTGWYGWVWGYDCAWHQAKTYNNVSFPAENCPIAGLHNGWQMYYWWGTVDACPNNQLQLNTGGGNCFDTVWGGMSGSGMYYIDGSSRYLHAVCSTSNRNDRGYYCRQWESWITYMTGTFIPDSRGSAFDIQALRVRATPTTITAGDTFSTANFFATNPTNGTANTNYQFQTFLSTNDNISTGDTLLRNSGFNWNFGTMSSVTVNMALDTIPINTPSGTYWYGVNINAGTDANDSNNDSDYWDAQQITVNGVADLVADWISAPSGSYAPGASFSVTYNGDNQGGDPSNTISVDVRASTNTTISTLDTQIGYFTHSGIAGGASVQATRTVTLPGGMSPGTYYIGFIIDSSDDVDSSNNTAYDATPITVSAPAGIFSDGFESGNTSLWSSTVP